MHADTKPVADMSLAALFSDGPFARLDDFDDGLVRERAPFRDVPDFGP